MKLSSYYYNIKYALYARKPRLALRIAKNYYEIIFRKKRPLRYIDACVNLTCNLKCDHCFATNFKDNEKKELSKDEWINVFDQCHKLGNIVIGFTGGEPLLYEGLEDLIRCANPFETLISISTNGMLLTPERTKSLYEAGADAVQISIESFHPDEHNLFRKDKDAFKKSMEGIQNALAAGLKVSVVPTVSRHNVYSKGFLALLEWAYQRKLLINMALATPMGRWNSRMDVLLKKEDFDFIDKLVKKYPNVRRDFETNYFIRGCGAATEKLYFTPFGDVFPCPYMHISFGNAREMRVTDIRANMFSIKELKKYHPKCLVAEDKAFINGPLSNVFKRGKVIHWKDVFHK